MRRGLVDGSPKCGTREVNHEKSERMKRRSASPSDYDLGKRSGGQPSLHGRDARQWVEQRARVICQGGRDNDMDRWVWVEPTNKRICSPSDDL